MLPQELREIETLGRCINAQDSEEGMGGLLALSFSCNYKSGMGAAEVLLETEFKKEYRLP